MPHKTIPTKEQQLELAAFAYYYTTTTCYILPWKKWIDIKTMMYIQQQSFDNYCYSSTFYAVDDDDDQDIII